MASGQELAAPQKSQRGTIDGGIGEVRPHMHTNGADGSRPEHGALARHKYGLLMPEDLADDPAAKDPQVSRDIPEEKDTRTRERSGQRALLACVHTEDKVDKQGPPKRQRALDASSHQGGEGGVTPTQRRALPARGQGIEGVTLTRTRASPVRSQ